MPQFTQLTNSPLHQTISTLSFGAAYLIAPAAKVMLSIFSSAKLGSGMIGWLLLFSSSLEAAECRVLVDGAGCRTRQLAMKGIWEKLPGVQSVEILPRDEAPKLNQRIFIVRSESEHPTKAELIDALGRRAKHYHVLEVISID